MIAFGKRYRSWRNRTTIRKQLSIIVGLAVSLTMAFLIVFNYLSQANGIRQQQDIALRNVLQSEMENLENYLDELLAYSIQLRNHQPFMDLLLKTKPFDFSQRQIVDSALKTYFYSRGDIQKMELYLIRQKTKYSLSQPVRKIMVIGGVEPSILSDYSTFTAKPDYSSIATAGNGFVQVTRTIIDSPRQTPLAVVRFTAGPDYLNVLQLNHAQLDEKLYVFDTQGRFCSYPKSSSESDLQTLITFASADKKGDMIKLAGEESLCVVSETGKHGIALLATKPLSIVNASLNATRNASILIGLVLLILIVIIVLSSIRFITTPLMTLANWIRRVGAGNFSTRDALEGSYEITGLSEDVNQMMKGVRDLIDSNYVAQINERTAKLTALEAQTNPHFLFNTLQAISSQAITNHQDQIYQMVSNLAAIIRYSIRGGNLDTLESELEHVNKYLSLQKSRFGERLSYTFSIEEKIRKIYVPKFCIMSLTENSIVHGLKGNVTSISINITIKMEHDGFVLCVSDNGCGIDEEVLERIRASLEKADERISENIGLINLASRLRLLYGGKAQMSIESTKTPIRATSARILIPMEVPVNV